MDDLATVLPASSAMVPKFRGKWIVPAALRQASDLLGAHRVMLLTALPGSGKTRFMTRLLSEMQALMHVCCWMRVLPQMREPGAISRCVATNLVRTVLGERSATATLLMGTGFDAGTILTVALNEIAAFDGSVTFFIDDFQVIDGADTVGGDAAIGEVQRLIDQAPGNLRIVMASRTTTRLKLARLRNDRSLIDLRHEDFELAFKQVPEIIAQLGMARPELAELRALWYRTGGWVAGITLLARGTGRGTARSLDANGFAASKDMAAYFEQEVLAGLSDDVRGSLDVLLVPHVLVHELIVALIGEADATRYLEELEALGLLTRSSHPTVRAYRAVPLLIETIRAQSLLGPDEYRLLHERCCDWFEAQGLLTDAVVHAVDAGNIERAIMLIERCGIDMIGLGDINALQAWLPRLPVQQLRRRPIALLAVAWALSLLYRLEEAANLLALLDEDLATDPALATTLDANMSALRVMQLSMRDDVGSARTLGGLWRSRYPDATDWFGNVVDNSISFSLALTGEVDRARLVLDGAYLPDNYARNPYAVLYSRCILGLIDLRDGQIRRADAHFSWAVKNAEKDLDPQSTGAVMAAGLLAGACYERNDIARVHELMDSYAWSLHAHLFTDTRFHAYRALARDQSSRGQYRAAITSLERVLDAGPSVRIPRVHVDVLTEKIVIALDHHDSRMANAYIRALGDQLTALHDEDHQRAYVEAALFGSQANLDIVLGAPESAPALLRQAIRKDLHRGWKLRAFHWAILMVRASWRQGRHRQAERLMRRLLGYAAPAGIFRTILDGGKDIEAVLKRVAANGDVRLDRRRDGLLRQLLETFDPTLVRTPMTSEAIPSMSHQLTEREIELIRFVRAGLTNRQIAERMQVSENTIKWHLKNVFDKASVKRRSELSALVLP